MANQSVVPCGIGLPQVFRDGPVDVRLVRDFATRAEGLACGCRLLRPPLSCLSGAIAA